MESLLQYFPVFDKLKKEFFIGEMIWNFADFMTQQGELKPGADPESVRVLTIAKDGCHLRGKRGREGV